ncbi:hypothetical protein THRCLA_05512 [Thraustotheca clavata]|uniref:Uncharacterized protein n=1 Tax=Thraustotheca clavata TaxID=74557 RepID=A0A1V9ZVQ5_9STRA|nr:hypothetical protein THRCLA_05512 [Thraustotheca clavata]
MAGSNGTSVVSSTAIVVDGAMIYGPMLLLGFLVFECVRSRFVSVYESSPKSQLPSGFLRWIPFLLRLNDDEIMHKCGLETLMFLRFLVFGKKLALVSVFLSIALFPAYYSENQEHATLLDRLTISGLTSGDKRLWATVFAAFGVSLYTMYMIYYESNVYKQRRHEFLAQLGTQQYSVLVDDLPKHLKSHAALKDYLESIFPNQVQAVYIAVESAELELRVAERLTVQANLEHAIMYERKYKKRLTHYESDKTSWWRYYKVDSIEFYTDRLNALNNEIRVTITSIEGQQRTGSVLLKQDQSLVQQEEHPIENEKTPLLPKVKHVAFDLRADVQSMIDRYENPPNVLRSAAFVAFSSLQATNTIQQIVQTNTPHEMKVQEAPPAEEIVWENVGRLNYVERKTALLFSIVITSLVIFFWTVPTTFVVAMASVESLRQVIPNLDTLILKFPFLQPLLQQLSPLLLVFMNGLAPTIFRILSVGEGHASQNAVEASLFTKYVAYQLVQVFFVSAIAGSLTAISNQIQRIAKEPFELVTLLGSSIPNQSTYFFSYLMVQTGLSMSLQLLRVMPIIFGVIYRILAPQLTPREKKTPWFGFAPMSATGKFDITTSLAQIFLMFLVILTFAPLAPLLCYMGGIFFAVSEIVYRRLIWCVYLPNVRSTGVYWPQLYMYLITALGISQITLIGLLSLKEAPSQVLVALILPALTALFNWYMRALYPPVSEYLPIATCVELDAFRAKTDQVPDIDSNLYKQPAMLATEPLAPEV